jgi:hypothetical protein
VTAVDWDALAARFPAAWIRLARTADARGEPVSETASSLAARDLAPEDRAAHPDLTASAQLFLDELADAGWLDGLESRRCPVCGFDLPAGHRGEACPNPEPPPHAFTDEGHPGPLVTVTYRRTGVARRDVGWMLALHGMNTRGAWQEDFNWLVSTTYGRMVPVAIYKYGIVRPGALLRARHRQLVRRLATEIRKRSRQAAEIVADPKPDVIAHSFGTLLLGKALQAQPDLRVGRVITLGCVLRPDFDWQTLVARGQVEAVLNQIGTRDVWARIAHYAVPDAGPAGRRGFDPPPGSAPPPAAEPVFNVLAEGFRHSTFFDVRGDDPTILARQFRDVWREFLTRRELADVAAELHPTWPPDRWRPSPWPLRAITGP